MQYAYLTSVHVDFVKIIHCMLFYMYATLFQVKELISGPSEMCYSSLMYDGGKGIRSLLLSIIGLKVL